MQSPGERPVLVGEHAVRSQSKTLLDWESAHLFLELVRCKSFRAAADHVGLSVNALRKRISDFEAALGVTLVTRHVDGVRLTAEGDKIYAAASKMEARKTGTRSARPARSMRDGNRETWPCPNPGARRKLSGRRPFGHRPKQGRFAPPDRR